MQIMTDTLGKLMGSAARVKVMRLFLFNPHATYSALEIAERAQVAVAIVRREILVYEGIELVKVKRTRGKREKAYTLNHQFEFLEALQHLLLNLPVRTLDIAKRVRAMGGIRLVVLAGIFVDDYQGRVDLLVVADKVEEVKLRAIIKVFEAEIGKELRYVALKTDEFRYRLDIYDKLVRDVLDYPHSVALDRLHLPLR